MDIKFLINVGRFENGKTYTELPNGVAHLYVMKRWAEEVTPAVEEEPKKAVKPKPKRKVKRNAKRNTKSRS